MKHTLSFFVVFFLTALSCNRVTHPLPSYEVYGIDVSHHQKEILWDSIANSYLDFVFVKATEGVTFKDSLFQHNWSALERTRLYKGAYHFFRPAYSGRAQAEHFLKQVDLGPGDLAPVLDVEVLDGVTKVKLLKEMYAWLYTVEIATGIKPIIYTNQKFFNKNLHGYFEDYPLWVARYNSFRTPKLKGDRNWDFWQYGNRGQLEGIAGYVDFNVFSGDLPALEEYCINPMTVLGP